MIRYRRQVRTKVKYLKREASVLTKTPLKAKTPQDQDQTFRDQDIQKVVLNGLTIKNMIVFQSDPGAKISDNNQ